MKHKKIKILVLFVVSLITISSYLANLQAQGNPGYYLGYKTYAPDGKWQCNCPFAWPPVECGCDYQS